MFKFFKKRIPPPAKEDPMDEQSGYIDMLMEMAGDDDLDDVMLDSVSKIYLINTYSSNVDELLRSVYDHRLRDDIACINLYSYIHGSEEGFRRSLVALRQSIVDRKVKPKTGYDISALYSAYCTLKGIEEKSYGI